MKEKVSPTQKALNVWAIILILWSIYRANFKTDFPLWFDEFIMKPLFFILPVYSYIHYIEKKGFFASVGIRRKNLVKEIILGLGIGLVFLCIGLFAGSFKMHNQNMLILFFSPATLYLVITTFATAFSEEVLSRGFVLKRLFDESKNASQAILIATVLFFFLHVPVLFTSDKITGYLLLRVMCADFLLSIASSILFIKRDNLVAPIIVHALYSLSLILFI